MADSRSGNNKVKQAAALIGVALLLLMIIATLVVACLKFEGSANVFKGLICCDIAIPVLLWFYLYLLKRASKTDDELEEKIIKDAASQDGPLEK